MVNTEPSLIVLIVEGLISLQLMTVSFPTSSIQYIVCSTELYYSNYM